MKLSARLSAAAAIVGASVLVIATPAIAAPWVSSYVIGGTNWGLRSSGAGIGHTYDGAGHLSSVSHHFGELYIDGNYAWCDEATADLETDADSGDVVITCDAQEVTPGIFVTPSYRLYSTGDLARLFYTIENRTGADITTSDFYLYDNYDDYGLYQTSSGGTSSVLSPDDKWVIVTSSSGSTVTGSVWAQTGNAATTSSGDISNEETFHDFVSTTFAAGSTTYVADFVTIHLPLDPYEAADTTVAFDSAVAAAPEFDTFSGRLVAGLPENITVLNWGETTPAAAPALANTGINVTETITAAGGALLLLVGGAGLIIARRSRVSA